MNEECVHKWTLDKPTVVQEGSKRFQITHGKCQLCPAEKDFKEQVDSWQDFRIMNFSERESGVESSVLNRGQKTRSDAVEIREEAMAIARQIAQPIALDIEQRTSYHVLKNIIARYKYEIAFMLRLLSITSVATLIKLSRTTLVKYFPDNERISSEVRRVAIAEYRNGTWLNNKRKEELELGVQNSAGHTQQITIEADNYKYQPTPIIEDISEDKPAEEPEKVVVESEDPIIVSISRKEVKIEFHVTDTNNGYQPGKFMLLIAYTCENCGADEQDLHEVEMGGFKKYGAVIGEVSSKEL